ncbi:arylsulfatase A-like enzyme [Pedobacter sp. AK017]|uniref:arylsulfatase n=1 Tax=Pedobacter sp. AK017 TaxID=2723073 RepID=UPI0016078F81|nr:arylsulfatase [Pedobacter sp. AK017]MBB5440341.1 arylsulfatase A-like enzyme [Pedobacter sp. AK017]
MNRLLLISVFLLLSQRLAAQNVILIYADDLGYAELGSYGQKKIKTPHLDQLAAQGLRLTQFYTGTPVCAPSRANLMTGLHAGHAQIRDNYGLLPYQENVNEPGSFPLKAGTATLGSLFKTAGYATAAIGKWGLGNHDNSGDPQKLGFDYFYGYYDQRQAHNYYPTHLWENGKWDTLRNHPMEVHPKDKTVSESGAYRGKDYAIDKMTEKAVRFIQSNKDRPFFLYFPITLPHGVLQEPTSGIDAYVKLFNEKPSGKDPITPYPKASYAAMVSYMDQQVGVIQNVLKKLRLDQNTIVIFTSDNGTAANVDRDFFNSTGGLRGVKQDVYEGGIREPFIIKWPGKIAQGKTSDYPVVTYDLMATFADLLQVKAPKNDGISVLDLFKGSLPVAKRGFLYWEYPSKGGQLAIRIGNLKGVKTNIQKNKAAAWQIYDLSKDPGESNDIASSHPELPHAFDAIVKKEHTPPLRPEWDIFKSKKESTEN